MNGELENLSVIMSCVKRKPFTRKLLISKLLPKLTYKTHITSRELMWMSKCLWVAVTRKDRYWMDSNACKTEMVWLMSSTICGHLNLRMMC